MTRARIHQPNPDLGTCLAMLLAAMLVVVQVLMPISQLKSPFSLSNLPGGDYFSPNWSAHALIDSATSGAIETAAYGGSLRQNILDDLKRNIVNEGAGFAFNMVGDIKAGNGSLDGILLHGSVGCIASSAQGGSCIEGATAAAGSEAFTGIIDHQTGGDIVATAEAVKRFVNPALAALTAGGDTDQFDTNLGIANAKIDNNYLSKSQLITLYNQFTTCESKADSYACRQQFWAEAQDNSRENYDLLVACGRDQACIDGHIANMADGDDIRLKFASTAWTGDVQGIVNTLVGTPFQSTDFNDRTIEHPSRWWILENSQSTTFNDYVKYVVGADGVCGIYCVTPTNLTAPVFIRNPNSTSLLKPSANDSKQVRDVVAIANREVDGERLLWGGWNDYPKIVREGPNGPQEYAVIGDRLYSQHAVARMQPSGQRYSSGLPTDETHNPSLGTWPAVEPGINVFDGTRNVRGRSVSPNHVEDIIRNVEPVRQGNGNLSYSSGGLQVITSSDGSRVVTIISD